MPQPTTRAVSSEARTTAQPYGRSGSGRHQKYSGFSTAEAPATQATYRKGRCTASVNRATRPAPPAVVDTKETGIIATANPRGQRRRNQTAAQESAPSSWSKAA